MIHMKCQALFTYLNSSLEKHLHLPWVENYKDLNTSKNKYLDHHGLFLVRQHF